MAISPRNLQQAQSLLSQGLTFVPGSGFQSSALIGTLAPTPAEAAPPPKLTPEAESATTGIEPQQLSAILYGKDIPVFVGGKMRIGGRIIEGPFFGGSSDAPTVSYIASHALCANPAGTRSITEFSLRGRVAWTSTDGALLSGLTVEFKTGSETQTPFSSSITRYGDSAIAYRGHILSCVTDLPLSTFAGVVPFPSVLVEDSTFGDPDDGITRNDALETILRYARLDDADFEVDVTGSDIAWILGQKTELVPFLQSLRKIFVNWNVIATDKLRIIEPSTFSVNATITRDNHTMESMRFGRAEPLTKPREKIYKFIDIDRDYEPNAATARQELFPFPTTSSIESETIELPIVTEASQAIVDVNYALFQSEVARKRLEFNGMVSLLGLEAGDGIKFEDHDHFRFRGRISETVKNAADWSIDVKAETWLNCELPPDDDIENVILLLSGDGTDASTTFVDESPFEQGTGTVHGSAQVDTGNKKFGSGSIRFDGAGDGLSWPSDSDFDLSNANSDEFTIEAWISPATSSPSDVALIARFTGVIGFAFLFWIDTNGELSFWAWDEDGDEWSERTTSSGITWTAEQWYHVAIDKDSSGKVRVYRDGVMVDSSTPTDSTMADAGGTIITVGMDGLGGRSFNGWIDEVRVTKGEARYASDAGFTPPTAPFPRT